jgi:hypothetical protein
MCMSEALVFPQWVCACECVKDRRRRRLRESSGCVGLRRRVGGWEKGEVQ